MPITAPKRSPTRFDIPKRLNIPADRLQKEMEWFTKEKSVPRRIANAIAATVWLLEVDAFREQEEEFMESGQYERLLPDHRTTLSWLIAKGEQLVYYARKFGMTPTPFTVDDLQSTVDSLHTTFRCEYRPQNCQKTNQLIEQALNGVF